MVQESSPAPRTTLLRDTNVANCYNGKHEKKVEPKRQGFFAHGFQFNENRVENTGVQAHVGAADISMRLFSERFPRIHEWIYNILITMYIYTHFKGSVTEHHVCTGKQVDIMDASSQSHTPSQVVAMLLRALSRPNASVATDPCHEACPKYSQSAESNAPDASAA